MINIQPLPPHANALGYYAYGCHSRWSFANALRRQQGIQMGETCDVVVTWDGRASKYVTVWVWWKWG